MKDRELKTKGIILKRVDYGESDRILNILTPEGKISAIARGARKAKSKLAGGIEMLTLTELVVQFGRGEMGVVTSAHMLDHFSEILKDFGMLSVAGELIRKSNAVVGNMNDSGVFEILSQSLEWMNRGARAALVEAWFALNIRKIAGEEINLYRDKRGKKLSAEKNYIWNMTEMAFEENLMGDYSAAEIKMLRLIVVSPLELILRIKANDELLGKVIGFSKMFSEL